MYERRYVEYALELAKGIGMTQLAFARAIWPEKTDAVANTTIIALRKGNSRGKPQNLRVSDAIKMSEVLGKEYPSMCFEVWERLKYELRDNLKDRPQITTSEKKISPAAPASSTPVAPDLEMSK